MEYDFSKITLVDLDGKEIKDPAYKIIANILYRSARTLDLVETARQINRGEVVELDKSEIQEIKDLMANPQSGVFAFTQKAIFDYVELVQKQKKESG